MRRRPNDHNNQANPLGNRCCPGGDNCGWVGEGDFMTRASFETTGNVEMMYHGCRVLLAQLVDGKMRINRRMMCALDAQGSRRGWKRINQCCDVVERYGKPRPEIDLSGSL